MSEIDPGQGLPDPPEGHGDLSLEGPGPEDLREDGIEAPAPAPDAALGPEPAAPAADAPEPALSQRLEETLSGTGPLALPADASADAELDAWLAGPAPDVDPAELHEIDLRLRERLGGG